MIAHTDRPDRTRLARRGSAYLLVLAAAVIVTVIGLSAATVSRINLRGARLTGDEARAEFLAMSAVEHALTILDAAMDASEIAATDWRDGLTHGAHSPVQPFGDGSYYWYLEDTTGDEDIGDDPNDPIRLYGAGLVGETARLFSVLLQPDGEPLDVLRTTIHASGVFDKDSDPMTTNGGPVSTNGHLNRGGTIDGDAEAVSASGSGTITGTLTVPAPAKPMPAHGIFDTLRDMAEEIPFANLDSGTVKEPLLSAAVNPYGDTNPNGIYYIDVPAGWDLKIKPDRLVGTMVVQLQAGARVKVTSATIWEPHSPEFPILVAKYVSGVPGQAQLAPLPGAISESLLGVNLNPPGTPYDGESDSDTSDIYPSELRGLIHIIGSTPTQVETQIGDPFVNDPCVFRGTIIADGWVNAGEAEITHDPNIYANPPRGYSTGTRVAPMSGSWRWESMP